jgi:hypothetical protein
VKKIVISFLIFITFVSIDVIAADVRGELRIIPEAKEYHEGDIVEFELKIWPIENAVLEEFRQLEGTQLSNSIEVEQITTIENSENNADVVLVKASGIILKAPSSSEGIVKYKNIIINISIPPFGVVALKSKKEDFFVLDQTVVSGSTSWWILILVVFAVLGTYVYLKKFRKKNDTTLDLKKSYQLLFFNAEKRHDFESIYAAKKEWVMLLATETQAHRDFFSCMEAHQYKKEWGIDEETEVKNSFDIIRRSFA